MLPQDKEPFKVSDFLKTSKKKFLTYTVTPWHSRIMIDLHELDPKRSGVAVLNGKLILLNIEYVSSIFSAYLKILFH